MKANVIYMSRTKEWIAKRKSDILKKLILRTVNKYGNTIDTELENKHDLVNRCIIKNNDYAIPTRDTNTKI